VSRHDATPEPTAGGNQQSNIVFRHLGTQMGSDCEPDWNWQVELHVGRGFPVGLAWVCTPPPGVVPAADVRTLIKFVLVVDDARNEGVASRLIEACRGRWPDAKLSLPISAAGARLYRKFVPPPRAEDMYNEDFIQAQLAAGVPRETLDQMARQEFDALIADCDEDDTLLPSGPPE